MSTQTRREVSVRLRFEVFKRDKFTCQYCGRYAPDVTLHADHIDPVSNGGSSDLINLITACSDCNFGKGARLLSDDSIITKQKAQLDQLQERREQLEMMMEWQKSLLAADDETTEAICDFWTKAVNGSQISESGKVFVRQWVKRFTVEEICNAIKIAAAQYLNYTTPAEMNASVEKAFAKIPGIIFNLRHRGEDPNNDIARYVHGILRNRGLYVNKANYWKMFTDAKTLDITINPERLKLIAKNAKSWTGFYQAAQEEIFGVGEASNEK